MAHFIGNIYSQSLGMATTLHAILPQDRIQNSQKCKVLYLLHGLSDDSSAWTRYTSLERYVSSRNVAVIMPEVQRSFYADAKYGLHYFQYISEEVPLLCKKMFSLSDRAEDTYIAGLSMGGYGAMKVGYSFPNQFAGIGAFSSACDAPKHIQDPNCPPEFHALFDGAPVPESYNLYCLTEKAKKEAIVPPLFMTCGKQDELYGENLALKAHMEKLELSNQYTFWDGVHCWEFWDKSIALFLDYFKI